MRWLPSETGTQTAAEGTTTGVIPAEGDGERARVLIADDNADMREYLTNLSGTPATTSAKWSTARKR